MRLLEHLEIENFKRFGEKQQITLDHPTVLIGPNNCGKTSAIQALALWSQAVRTWYDARRQSGAKERTATPLNRLNIVSVPVQRTRYFWHKTQVRTGNKDIPLRITVGLWFRNELRELTMRFRNQGDEIVYCTPDDASQAEIDLIGFAASIRVELLYPMSGLETEEPVLQPGRIDVLLGQGQTAQVLRNLCLMVHRDSADDWTQVQSLMKRLFSVDLGVPSETARGAIQLLYRQAEVKEALDVSMSGRGFQQMLLIFAYLYSHKGSVLLIDEPDAHLEILRQKQVYILLRDIAGANGSQVILATHSEVILDEAVDNNLILFLDGKADNLSQKKSIRNSLKLFGTEHYLKARERGYVLYVEGSTDIDMLRALAKRLQHPVATEWDERINAFYVQNVHPSQTMDAELERVEGTFDVTPRVHFNDLLTLLPSLSGLAILDNDGRNPQDAREGRLRRVYWRRYELENYFITPQLLRTYAREQLSTFELFSGFEREIDEVLEALLIERLFDGRMQDYEEYKSAPPGMVKLLWDAKTERMKLSDFAEDFFRRLASRTGGRMLLTKGQLHTLVGYADPAEIAPEVSEKLDLLRTLFASSTEAR